MAAAGETILVIEGDRVVAELGPPKEGRESSATDAPLTAAIREGLLTPARIPGGGPPPRRPVATLDVILQGLKEDRSDR